jgi:hypothetical protein
MDSKKFKITVNLTVDQVWIDDGFDPRSEVWVEKIKTLFEEKLLPWANSEEVTAVVTVKSIGKQGLKLGQKVGKYEQ